LEMLFGKMGRSGSVKEETRGICPGGRSFSGTHREKRKKRDPIYSTPGFWGSGKGGLKEGESDTQG